LVVLAFLAAGPVRVTVNSGPSTLLVWLSVISTVATVAAVVFAWRAAVSAREANRYARETAQAAEEANTLARQTTVVSREASAYARQTVEATRAAHEAHERDRRLEELREIGRLVESIFWAASAQRPDLQLRVVEQNDLAQALAGIDPPMPSCHEVVSAATAGQMMGAAGQARIEVEIAIRNLRASAPTEAAAPPPPTSP
jgi:hypothetical protein